MGEGLTGGRGWRRENGAAGVEARTRALVGTVAQGSARTQEPRPAGLAKGSFPVLCDSSQARKSDVDRRRWNRSGRSARLHSSALPFSALPREVGADHGWSKCRC